VKEKENTAIMIDSKLLSFLLEPNLNNQFYDTRVHQY